MGSARFQWASRRKRPARRERRGARAAGLRPRRLCQEPLESRTLLSVTPHLIDLNPSGASSPTDFVHVGSTTFFAAEDATYGRELWKTDGTAQGTSLVKDIRPGSASSDPGELVDLNGALFFVADDGVNGKELWKSDGTPEGTSLVTDIRPGSGSSDPGELVDLNGTLFFVADDGVNGRELWKSDGTAEGTVLVRDIFPGTYTNGDGTYPNASDPQDLVNLNGTLFFTADDGASGRELWKSDGTEAGTVLVKDLFPGTYPYYDNGNYEGERPNASGPDKLTAVDGQLFFIARDEIHGTELWKSDGTEAGTALVKDIYEGTDDGLSQSDWLKNVDGTLFFTAAEALNGRELWKSDGTAAGTVMVKDISPGGHWYDEYIDGIWVTGYTPDSSSPQEPVNVSGMLFFSADNGVNGRELWKSDGTAAGTVMVKDVFPGSVYDPSSSSDVPNSSSPQHLTEVGGKLYFAAADATSGRELWASDGTAGGTFLMGDIVAGTGGSSPQSLFSHDGTLLFSADDGVAGRELWTFVDEVESEVRQARLTIFIDGQPLAIPTNIGVASGGAFLSQVHTVDGNCALRIESIAGEPLGAITLGDFFETWRANAGLAGNNADAVFNEGEIFGYTVDGEHWIQMFVGGQANRRFDEYTIQDGDEIAIVYTANEVVSLNTNLGSILIELFPADTPLTVANFLDYVNDGDYVNTFFHRSANLTTGEDFVIQTGGFTTPTLTYQNLDQFEEVPEHGYLQNEPGLPNVRGTVAMAKMGSSPAPGVDAEDSATSQFYINMRNNGGEPAYLDTQNGGFTVFGWVLDMSIADQIAALGVDNLDLGDDNDDGYEDSLYDQVPFTGNDELVVIQSIGGEGDLAGTSFEDLDFDGAQDAGEAGLAGATVFADANDNGVLDEGELWTTTDSAGGWQLTLPAGTYVIRQESTGSLFPTTSEGTGAHTLTVEVGRLLDGLDFANVGNAPPVAAADAYSVAEDGTLTIDAENGVLANDTDPEGDSLTAVLVSNPLHGDLTLAGNGSFTYTPDDDFYGTDTFTYRAQDGDSQSPTVTVTITVQSQPDAPAAVGDQFTLPEGDQVHELDVLDNDTSDPDGAQSLSIIAVTQGSSGGTVTTDGSTVDYTPVSGFSGTETFTYTVEDADGLADQAMVTVTVDNVAAATASGSIAGYVYFDSDNDGQRDAREVGVSGAMVTLTGVDNQGNSVSRSVLTSADGSYLFDELAPGTYAVAETQPAALLDGKDTVGTLGGSVGDDRFSGIVLGEDEHSTGNNFGERGLRPGFITLNMFLASTPPCEEYLPELMARAEETAGRPELAPLIRWRATKLPDPQDDAYTVEKNGVLTVPAAEGVLVNDLGADVYPGGELVTKYTTAMLAGTGPTIVGAGITPRSMGALVVIEIDASIVVGIEPPIKAPQIKIAGAKMVVNHINDNRDALGMSRLD